MASIHQANVMEHLQLEPSVMARFKADAMSRIGAALAGWTADRGAGKKAGG